MDVLFVSIDDWANVGALCAKACKAAGLEARAVARRHHQFDYPTPTGIWKGYEALQDMVDDSRAVVFMHSQYLPFLKLDMSKQKVAVFHGGKIYRERARKIAEALYTKLHKTFIQDGTLFGFGSRNETLLIPPIDDQYFTPKWRSPELLRSGLIFGSYPRATGNGIVTKGLDKIITVMKGFTNVDACRFWQSMRVRPWLEHLKRVNNVDVYIEKMGLEVREWGMSALEAAALGKVVITNFENREQYEAVHGEPPFLIANDTAALKEKVSWLINARPEQVSQLQKETRDWVIRTHGLKATGKYLKDQLHL